MSTDWIQEAFDNAEKKINGTEWEQLRDYFYISFDELLEAGYPKEICLSLVLDSFQGSLHITILTIYGMWLEERGLLNDNV